MLPHLNGQKVFGYVDDTIYKLTKTITAFNGFTLPNPSYAN